MLRRVRRSLPIALAALIPAILAGWTLTAVFAQTPSPGASPSAAGSPGASPSGSQKVQGDPQQGQQLYSSAGCTSCHGANLEGGIGPKLNPIEKLPDTQNPLNPAYLVETITNGKKGVGGFSASMPPKGGDSALTTAEINDIAAYIIQANEQGPQGLDPVTLARSNVFWVTASVFLLVVLTWLLARYNMRWIARRAEARRERERLGR
jgi:mono/diheme cytochrome c family protein